MAEQHMPRDAERIATAQGILTMCRDVKADVARIESETEALLATLEAGHETPVEAPLQRPVQPSQHLREHRPGRPKKLAADPELRAFVEARFNQMTFEQIADEVAQHFPPERRVAKSAIHAWWHAHYKRK